MKHIFILFLSFVAFPALAVTSKSYVDSAVAPLQNEIPAVNTDTVLTNTGTAGEIGTKKIYDETQSFETQTDALVTAATFNAAVQNAIDNEFVCVESIPEGCLLYKLQKVAPKNNIPTTYTELGYIESSGTQWLRIPPMNFGNQDVTVNAVFEPTMMSASGYHTIFGSIGYFQAGYGLNGSAYNNGFTVAKFYSVGKKSSVTGILSTTAGNGKYFVDNVDTNTSKQFASHAYVYVFANGRGAESAAHGKLYKLDMVQNGNLIKNLVPAKRIQDGVVGMYDTIDGTFYTNIGTGTFIAGPDVNSNLYLPSGN